MKDDIIRMAREASNNSKDALLENGDDLVMLYLDELERFAALVAAAEREVIAQSLDKQADLACDDIDRQWAQEMAAAVRARGNT